jgi:hypothetical protein
VHFPPKERRVAKGKMMKNVIEKVFIVITLAVSISAPSLALADVKDRVISANVAPEVLYQRIVTTATAMCREAEAAGEVANLSQCVDVVVARTVAEINRPNLTSYARAILPSSSASAS